MANFKENIEKLNNTLFTKFEEKQFVSLNYAIKVLNAFIIDCNGSIVRKDNNLIVSFNDIKVIAFKFSQKRIVGELSVYSVNLEKEYLLESYSKDFEALFAISKSISNKKNSDDQSKDLFIKKLGEFKMSLNDFFELQKLYKDTKKSK